MNPSKQKGNRFERELVEIAKAHSMDAKRAWGSNGKAMGLHEEVDIELIVGDKKLHLQAKRRARLPSYIKPNEHVQAQVIREDRGIAYVVLEYDEYLLLLKEAYDKT